MSLEYYLFCRESYKEIISNLENTIKIYEMIIHNTFLEEENIDHNYLEFLQPKVNNNFLIFIQQLTHIKILKKMCDDKIIHLCSHEFVDDSIDIDPDRSENITYCKICGFTK
jgi:hypothetical protein